MKEGKTKRKLLSLLCAGTLVLTGASVWEGAATTAPEGVLPAKGNYAATNSFPKNTVVEITNLETGKTIQAIVSSGLDTPGLLATLSEDAAKNLGLPIRSIGRIRMTQPSDPIAFSRFTEGLAGSGDPDYDPGAMIEADGYEDGEDYSGIVDIPGSEEQDEEESRRVPEDREGRLAEEDEEDDSPEKTLYPRWARDGSRAPVSPDPAPEPDIAEIPAPPPPHITEAPTAPPLPHITETPVAPPPKPEPGITETPAASPPKSEPGIAETPAAPPPKPEPDIAEIPAAPPPSPSREPAQMTTQTQGGQGGSWASAWVTIPQTPAIPPAPGPYDYSLVPAEQRPPVAPDSYTIPPETRIDPIVQVPPVQSFQRPEPVIDESLFIESIEDMRKRRGPPGSVTPDLVVPALPEPVPAEPFPVEAILAEPFPVETVPPEEVFILEEPAPPKVIVSKAPAESPKMNFSIPVIEELEKGRYYLQLGAYSKPEILESSVGRVGKQYPLCVQPTGSPDKPIYRLLLGPVNLGESGALLQRFKGSGYRDAFVRRTY